MNMGVFDLNILKWSWGHSMHFFPNRAVTWKRFISGANGRKFGTPGDIMYQHGSLGFTGLRGLHNEYFWPQACQGHLGVIRCTLINVGHDAKYPYCRLKWKTWPTCVYVEGIWVPWAWISQGFFSEAFGTLCSKLRHNCYDNSSWSETGENLVLDGCIHVAYGYSWPSINTSANVYFCTNQP